MSERMQQATSPTGSEAVIELRDVTKSFGDKAVLRGLDLKVYRGETLVVLGASGSGKSVTLRHMVGLMHADRGEVIVMGRDVATLGPRELMELRGRVALIFQGNALFDSLTIFENVAFGLRERRELTEQEIRAKVGNALQTVDLENVESLKPSDLSGGMKKRVALARSMVLEPEVLLYDEPTAGLDPVTGHLVARLIRDTGARSDMTSVVVTHDLPTAFRIADRMMLLVGGRKVFQGSPREVRASDVEELREFLYASETPAERAPSGGRP